MKYTSHEEMTRATFDDLYRELRNDNLEEQRFSHVLFDQPLASWWMTLLLDGLVSFGNADISWDMEDYGREPGNVCFAKVGHWRVGGELHEAVLRAYMHTMLDVQSGRHLQAGRACRTCRVAIDDLPADETICPDCLAKEKAEKKPSHLVKAATELGGKLILPTGAKELSAALGIYSLPNTDPKGPRGAGVRFSILWLSGTEEVGGVEHRKFVYRRQGTCAQHPTAVLYARLNPDGTITPWAHKLGDDICEETRVVKATTGNP